MSSPEKSHTKVDWSDIIHPVDDLIRAMRGYALDKFQEPKYVCSAVATSAGLEKLANEVNSSCNHPKSEREITQIFFKAKMNTSFAETLSQYLIQEHSLFINSPSTQYPLNGVTLTVVNLNSTSYARFEYLFRVKKHYWKNLRS